MDVLEFVSSLVKSLAWPAALVTVAIVFRRPIRRILNRLAKRVGSMTEVSAWKMGAKFAEKTALVTQEIADEASAITPPIEPDDAYSDDFAGESPREIVMLAWLDLEEHVRHAAEVAGIPGWRNVPIVRLRRLFRPDIQERLQDLQKLRNEAVHMREFSVSRDSAIAYARAASKLGAIVRHPSTLHTLRDHARENPASEK